MLLSWIRFPRVILVLMVYIINKINQRLNTRRKILSTSLKMGKTTAAYKTLQNLNYFLRVRFKTMEKKIGTHMILDKQNNLRL
jgi:hypothetical protein